jgi:hypothetical protein
MIQGAAFAVWLTMPVAAIAQICALGPGASSYKTASDQRPSADALELVRRTDEAAGKVCGSSCPPVVLFRNATAPNLILMVDAGRARIVYSPQAFAAVYERHGDAGLAALIAHEIGHALDDAMGAAWIEKAWTPELRADAWAGCILAKDNLTAAEIPQAMAALKEYPSPAHPGWGVRLPAIRSGYTHCGGTAPLDAGAGKAR